MVAAVEAGFPQAEIAEASYVYQRAFENGERLMVGVNAHVERGEEEPDIHRADPEVERRQIERLRAWRDQRDAADHTAALGALRAACEGDENVMPRLVAAAHARATIGEMCDVLRQVWGAYRDPARW
jgi:methylmalonyl-CoA mutase N-terminal domain/subunit